MTNNSIDECKDFQTLFEIWKNKAPRNVKGFEINHKDNVFISDGIVNPLVWNKQKPRILFVLKEAYSDKNDGDWSLTDWVASGECLITRYGEGLLFGHMGYFILQVKASVSTTRKNQKKI